MRNEGPYVSRHGLEVHGISSTRTVYWNLTPAQLYEQAILRDEAKLAREGPLVASTGSHTGRSPNDRYVVRDGASERDVWWGDVNKPFPRERFDALLERVRERLGGTDAFVFDGYAGTDPAYRMRVRVVTELGWHNLFARNMFVREEDGAKLAAFEPEFTVLGAPSVLADPATDGTRSSTFIILDLERRMVIIGGTAYAGEIKKSIFSVMNYYLPKRGVLSMHCSANYGAGPDDVALFFGLSGTGKTTLSADPERTLIGDDEHGWSDAGVFNVEGGCYAKMIRLSPAGEPEIYATTKRFGTILENVAMDPQTRRLDLDDDRLTENTRGSYPIDQIANADTGGRAGHPKNVVFLTADAFGVLPPIARLTHEQAMYHFLSGYTAKVAGTERGVTEPKATFSACFGAPFLPLHPGVYAKMLGREARAARRQGLARQHRLDRRPLRGGEPHQARFHTADGVGGALRRARPGAGRDRPGLRPGRPEAGRGGAGRGAAPARDLEEPGRLRRARRQARRDVRGQLREVRGRRLGGGQGRRSAQGRGLTRASPGGRVGDPPSLHDLNR